MADSNWLLRRLSPEKDVDPRWTGLATALQSYWEAEFDPLHDALLRLRSVYTATPEDLARKMREKGDYFSPDFPTEYDQPLAVAWRESEVLRKNFEFLFKSVFRRNFANLNVSWIPLYANKRKAYGTDFIAEPDLLPWQKQHVYYETSRGRLSCDLGHIHRQGMTKTQFLGLAENLVFRYKPAHIVYDGPIFYINLPIPVDEVRASMKMDRLCHHPIAVDFMLPRFDYLAADAEELDLWARVPFTMERDIHFAISFVDPQETIHLDPYISGDGVDADWIRLDSMRHGYDAAPFRVFDLAAVDVRTGGRIDVEQANVRSGKTDSEPKKLYYSDEILLQSKAETVRTPVIWDRAYEGLDNFPFFDELPCDFSCLDMPIGGEMYG